MQLIHRFTNEAIWLALGIFVSMAIVVLGTRILTTNLSTLEYGRLALMISLAAIFDQVAGHAIGGSAMRFYTVYQSKRLLGDLKATIFIYLLASGVICIFIAVLVGFIQWPAGNVLLVIFSLAFSMALLVSGVGVRLVEAARQRKVSAFFRISFELARFGMATIFIYLISQTAESVIAGFLIGACIIAGSHIYYICYRLPDNDQEMIRSDKQKELARSFLVYARPLMIVGLGTWIFLMSPLWAMGWFGEISQVGIYAAYHQLAFVPMLVISGLLLTYFAPILYENVSRSFEKAMKDSLRFSLLTLLMVIIIAMVAYLGHKPISFLLLGEHFRADSWIFPWLIIAGGCFGVAQQLLLRFRAEMRTAKLAVIQLAFAVIAILFYSVAAKYFELSVVVYTVTAVNALLLITAFISSGHLKRNNMKSANNTLATFDESGPFQ